MKKVMTLKAAGFMAFLPALVLTACSNDLSNISTKMARDTLNDHYAKECIAIGDKDKDQNFPVVVDSSKNEFDDWGHPKTQKFDALVTVGLLSADESSAGQDDKSSAPGTKRYSMTDKGRAVRAPGRLFCAGYYRVNDIRTMHAVEPWKGEPAVSVVYRLNPAKVPGWAYNYRLRKAWPELRHLLRKKQRREMILVQTPQGWATEEEIMQKLP